jgi:hypothetical protein
MVRKFARLQFNLLPIAAALVAASFLILTSSGAALAAGPTGPVPALGSRVVTCFQGASPRCPNFIFFRRGATSGRVYGRLFNINDKRYFMLSARAGQHMKVTITGAGPTRGIVTAPSGAQDGQPGGLIYDAILPQTGNYLIEVSESSMGTQWVGDFHIDISIR